MIERNNKNKNLKNLKNKWSSHVLFFVRVAPGTAERPREAYPFNWAKGPSRYPSGLASEQVYVLELYPMNNFPNLQ